MNRFFLYLALFLQFALLPTSSWAAESCESCTRRARSVCALRCDKSKNRLEFDTCSSACVQRSCAERCVAKTSEEEINEEEENCADCVARHVMYACVNDCDPASPHASRCKRDCAQRKCAKHCVMPDPGESKLAPKKSKYACDNCKLFAEQQCALPSVCEDDAPGAVACRFKCVHDRCADECLTE